MATDENIKFAKIRSCHGKGFASQGSAEEFYNFNVVDKLEEKSELIICEGEMDALSYFESGKLTVCPFHQVQLAKVVMERHMLMTIRSSNLYGINRKTQ